MDAVSLTCPTCGAPAAPEQPACGFCHARLATVTCPGCYALMFSGARHCSRCGAEVSPGGEVTSADTRRCPRCAVSLEAAAVGDAYLDECPQCAGVWLDVASFGRICANREQQAIIASLGTSLGASLAGSLGDSVHHDQGQGRSRAEVVRYIPCPTCGRLMNRLNFGHCSGVIVDLCKTHGVWFDQDELPQVVTLIQGGGLERARAREMEALVEERRKLAAAQKSLAMQQAHDAQELPTKGAPAVVQVTWDVIHWLLHG